MIAVIGNRSLEFSQKSRSIQIITRFKHKLKKIKLKFKRLKIKRNRSNEITLVVEKHTYSDVVKEVPLISEISETREFDQDYKSDFTTTLLGENEQIPPKSPPPYYTPVVVRLPSPSPVRIKYKSQLNQILQKQNQIKSSGQIDIEDPFVNVDEYTNKLSNSFAKYYLIDKSLFICSNFEQSLLPEVENSLELTRKIGVYFMGLQVIIILFSILGILWYFYLII